MFQQFRKERLFNYRAIFLVTLKKAKGSCNRFSFLPIISLGAVQQLLTLNKKYKNPTEYNT